jgi:hypothetical protein
VAKEYQANGRRLEWPNGVLPEDARTPEDFPAVIWAEAEARWDAKSEAEQEAELAQAEARAHMFKNLALAMIFFATFDVIDILWIGLAVFTAFKIGSGATD